MNALNKVYIFLIAIILGSAVFQIQRTNQKVNYRTGCFSAIPLHVRSLYFSDKRTDELGHFYDPYSDYFAWGQVNQHFDNNRIDIPDSLHIKYLSYTDSLFYGTTIPLNAASPIWEKYKTSPESLIFTLGIADKGIIKLWCSSKSLGTRLILSKRLPVIRPQAEDLYYNKPLSETQYISEIFGLLDDSIKNNIRQNLYKKDYSDSINYQTPDYFLK